ncbi:MAG: RraA family protein [Acidobacteriales bacterium]|nr:RraA family protein [Terriglobales bacterium]
MMRKCIWLLAALSVAVPAPAQLFRFTREDLVKYTAGNPYERFPDGRPKVPDDLLEKLRALSMEDVWAVLRSAGFNNQYEGGWRLLQPGKKLVGRAVTAQYIPSRPDVNDLVAKEGTAAGRHGGQNQWVIDTLQKGDVLVADLFGKVENGTMVGDNLAAAIFVSTGAGFVIDGGIRDLEGIHPIGMAGYYRGEDPTAFADLMCTGINIPVRIGRATVMPGDIVLGDREGVYFIPPALAQKIVDRAVETRIHDDWTQMKLRTGKYKSSEIYSTPHDPELKREYEEYRKKRLGK